MAEIVYPKLSYEVQGALFDVYNVLRHHDLSEEGWENALLIALADRGISTDRQLEYELHYRDYRIGRFFVDVLADGRLLLELKVRSALQPIDRAQTLMYLKASGLKLGILVNFGADQLDFERIPNFIRDRSPVPIQDDHVENKEHLLYPELTAEVRNALYAVHGELGPGFMHMHYRRATQIELRLREVPYEVQKEVIIHFRGQPIEKRKTRLLIIDGRVLLAPIAVRQITPGLRARLHQYLQLLDLRLALVANFHGTSLDIQTVRL